MNAANVRAELEEELTRRLEDIRFFREQLKSFGEQDDQERFCKCLVVMLYSHFEGFWRAAFSIYIKAINQESLKCRDAIEHLVAASMSHIYQALSDQRSKSDFFRRKAPDDTKLHRFARHMEFAGRLSEVLDHTVDIPTDDIVDTESNLTPVVVRKNLFRLGFAQDEFQNDEGAIQELLQRRNDIAHGSVRTGVSVDTYDQLELAISGVMNRIVVLIFDALRTSRFRKATQPAEA